MAEEFTSLMEELRTLTNSSRTNSSVENSRSCDTECFDNDDDFSSCIEDLGLPSHSIANSASEAPERDSLYQAHCGMPVSSTVLVAPSSNEVLLPSEHMKDVGQSLPVLASELVAARCAQQTEVEHKEELLKKLKEEHLCSAERHICAVAKGICLAEDEAARITQEIENLKKEINSLVPETHELGLKLKHTREMAEREQRVQLQYREKMARHRAVTEEVEQASSIQQELEELRRKINSMKERRCSYLLEEGLQLLSGEKQRTLQDQIATAEATRTVLEQENREKQNRFQLGVDHIQQLRREAEMAKKRHQAHLTRLHRQLQEAQARRRQWGEEADRLKMAVVQLQQKIGEH